MIGLSNVHSEQAVLAGICKHGQEAYVDVNSLLDSGTFTLDVNKVLYKCIANSIESSPNGLDLTDILSSAESLNLGDFVGREKYLSHINTILNTAIDLDVVLGHAKKIRRLQFARDLQNELRETHNILGELTGEEELAAILAMAEKPIQDVCLSYMREDENTPELIGKGLHDYIQNLIDNPVMSLGIPTGYPSYDEAIGGGLRRKCVDLISARPKMGKSLLTDNVAEYITKTHGVKVLVLDTEMSKEDHANRLIALKTGVKINEISKGSFRSDPVKVAKVWKAKEELENIGYSYMSVAGKPFEEIISIMRRWVIKEVGYDENGRTNDCVIIYDYLKLMNSSAIGNNMAEFQVLGFQITQLHNFMVEYDCACLAFTQLNRDGITKESTDAVSGSDRLIWLCTSFTIFKDKTPEEIATDGIRNGNRKLIPLVSRHGPGIDDNGYICLNMEGDIATIKEIGYIRNLKHDDSIPDREDSDSEAEDYDGGF